MAKDFKQVTNPALQFMTQQQESTPAAPVEEKAAAVSKGMRGRPVTEGETRSKRVNLLMLPSLYDDVSKIATMKRTSVNDFISTLLQAYVEDNKELLDKYSEVFGE